MLGNKSPGERVRLLNDEPFRGNAKYMLYWSQMNRRVDSNHALQYAASLANENRLPLLVYECLTSWYPFASNRLHTFILEGVPAILTGIMAPLASRLLTAEIVGFEILVWIPKLVAGPHDHVNWAGNAICIAIAGAAWAVSDSICRTAKRVTAQEESSKEAHASA